MRPMIHPITSEDELYPSSFNLTESQASYHNSIRSNHIVHPPTPSHRSWYNQHSVYMTPSRPGGTINPSPSPAPRNTSSSQAVYHEKHILEYSDHIRLENPRPFQLSDQSHYQAYQAAIAYQDAMSHVPSPQEVRQFDAWQIATGAYNTPYCSSQWRLPSQLSESYLNAGTPRNVGWEHIPSFDAPVAHNMNVQERQRREAQVNQVRQAYSHPTNRFDLPNGARDMIRVSSTASPASFGSVSTLGSIGSPSVPVTPQNRLRGYSEATASSGGFSLPPALHITPGGNLTPKRARTGRQKTEICRYYSSGRSCPFGDKCSYAHGDGELRNATMSNYFPPCSTPNCTLCFYKGNEPLPIEAKAFRSHLCPTWVATGACPYKNRCSFLHDPRVEASHNAYVLSKDMLARKPFSPPDKNSDDCDVLQILKRCFTYESEVVDSLFNVRNAHVLRGHSLPLYGPAEGPNSFMPGFKTTYKAVCNIDVNIVCCTILGATMANDVKKCNLDFNMSRYQSDNNSCESFLSLMEARFTARNGNRSILMQRSPLPKLSAQISPQLAKSTLTECQRLKIALMMRGDADDHKYIKFWPTHTLYSRKGCMLLQSRAFWVSRSGNDVEEAAREDISHQSVCRSMFDLVTVHEVCFGPAEKPDVLPCSMWFNLVEGRDLVPCSTIMAKKYVDDVKGRKTPCRNEDENHHNSALLQPNIYFACKSPILFNETDPFRPFFQIRPYDIDAFNLVTLMMKHRCAFCCNSITEEQSFNLMASIEGQYRAQSRFCDGWSWPKNYGHPNDIRYNSFAPLVNGEYEICPSHNCYTSEIWSSFINTMHSSPDTPRQKKRLPVLKHLSSGSSLAESVSSRMSRIHPTTK